MLSTCKHLTIPQALTKVRLEQHRCGFSALHTIWTLLSIINICYFPCRATPPLTLQKKGSSVEMKQWFHRRNPQVYTLCLHCQSQHWQLPLYPYKWSWETNKSCALFIASAGWGLVLMRVQEWHEVEHMHTPKQIHNSNSQWNKLTYVN